MKNSQMIWIDIYGNWKRGMTTFSLYRWCRIQETHFKWIICVLAKMNDKKKMLFPLMQKIKLCRKIIIFLDIRYNFGVSNEIICKTLKMYLIKSITF